MTFSLTERQQEAQRVLAAAEHERIVDLVRQGMVTPLRQDQTLAALRQAQAGNVAFHDWAALTEGDAAAEFAPDETIADYPRGGLPPPAAPPPRTSPGSVRARSSGRCRRDCRRP